MDKIKRLLLVHMPGSACNLRCEYCYITNQKLWGISDKKLNHTPEEIGKALSQFRLGGVCFINFCGSGETLLSNESIQILKALLNEGHYVEVVTNGVLSKRFDEIEQFPEEFRKRLTFKFSFHYKELKTKDLLHTFFENVYKMHNAGCSFTVEMTPYDGIEEFKSEILEVCDKYLGSPCQLTIARDDMKKGIPVMSQRNLKSYCDFWSDFDSGMMKFKKSVFGVKRKEFCYAGMYSANIRLSNGDISKCYSSPIVGNIFENLDKPINFEAIGKCPVAHCYNGHAHLTLGLVPELKTPYYTEIRNIHLKDGTDSLTDTFKEFWSQRVTDNNPLLSLKEQKAIYKKESIRQAKYKLKLNTKELLKSLGVNKVYKAIWRRKTK